MNAREFVIFLIATAAGYFIFNMLTSYVSTNTAFVFIASVLIIYFIYMWIEKQMRGASR